jgi:tetratricopeptide (TPR) repeat protein
VSPELLAKLGAALRDAGDLRGSAAAFEQARAAGNQSPDLASDLAVVYARLGRSGQAGALFRELLGRDPNAGNTWYNFGLFELQNHRPEAAADAFRHATRVEPSYGEAWQALGAALISTDRRAALDAWRRAERLLPNDYDLLFNLAVSLADSEQPSDALPYLQRFSREAPPQRYARDIDRVNQVMARLARAKS